MKEVGEEERRREELEGKAEWEDGSDRASEKERGDRKEEERGEGKREAKGKEGGKGRRHVGEQGRSQTTILARAAPRRLPMSASSATAVGSHLLDTRTREVTVVVRC